MKNLIIEDLNYIKLKKAGILPRYTNCGSEKSKDIKTNRVPFSTYYHSYQDYLSDKKTAVDIACSGLEIPDELIEKLQKTKEEIDLIY